MSGSGDGSEISEATEAMNHGENELFDLFGLHLRLGEELGRAKAQLRHFTIRDLAAGVDDEWERAQARLLTEPLNEGEAVAVGKGEIEDKQIGAARDATANSLLARAGVVDRHVGVPEAGDDDAGEVLVILNEQDLRRSFATVENAAKFSEEQVLIERLLNPALSASGELASENGRENAEDDDGNEGGGWVVAQALQRLPTTEPGHVEVEEDGFDMGLGGKEDASSPEQASTTV